MCRAGASWAQSDLLSNNPKLRIKVYAVWFDVLASDARDQWDPSIFSDPRVTQFWDGGRRTGDWFASKVTGQRAFAWDAYFLYGPASRWVTIPTELLASGSPVIAGTREITRSLHLKQR